MSYKSNLERYRINWAFAKTDIERLGKAVGSLNGCLKHTTFGDILREIKAPTTINDYRVNALYNGFDSDDSEHIGAFTKIGSLMDNREIPITSITRTWGRTVEMTFFDFVIYDDKVLNDEVRVFNNKFELLGTYTVEQVRDMEIKKYDTLVWTDYIS